MNIEITQKQSKLIWEISQNAIKSTLNRLRSESDDYFIDSGVDIIDKIVINNITTHTRITVYVDIYITYPRYDFDDVTSEISYTLRKFIPNAVVLTNDIIDERDSGPGIDW
jgi:hypothetical protein